MRSHSGHEWFFALALAAFWLGMMRVFMGGGYKRYNTARGITRWEERLYAAIVIASLVGGLICLFLGH